jgi:hypothetical protein
VSVTTTSAHQTAPGRRRPPGRRLLAALLAVLAVAAAACGGSSGGGATAGTGVIDPDGTFRYVFVQNPSTFDPHKSANPWDMIFFRLVYDQLIMVGEDGQLEPQVATSWKFVENDTALVLTLRDDVRVHRPTARSSMPWRSRPKSSGPRPSRAARSRGRWHGSPPSTPWTRRPCGST